MTLKVYNFIFQVSGETSQSTDGNAKECPPVKATILAKNSVVKGYHAFKIKPPSDTQLIVDREYTNINDKDACLIWVPELTTFDPNLHDMVTDEQTNLRLSDIAGLPIGHVPRVLASCFYHIIDSGDSVFATVTGDPVQSFPPWPAPSEKGGGAVIPCDYTLVVKDKESVLTLLKETLAKMPEGDAMTIEIQ
jgi:hypothetical protein